MTFRINKARCCAQIAMDTEERDPDKLYGEARMSALLLMACEEIERLRAVVDRLPKTADGVHILPGDSLWRVSVSNVHKIICDTISALGWWDRIGNYYMNDSPELSRLYASRESAESARKGV
jgi:hypothetical protein